MRKIQDEQEVRRWFAEGRTYAWMSEQYLSKYHIQTTPSMWGNVRRRLGLDRRQTRNDDLIPWAVNPEHRYHWSVQMLRAEGRRREGKELPADIADRLETWKRGLEEDDVVIHYDADTDEGFFRVPRREGVDTDLVRVPEHKTSRKATEYKS